MKNKSENPMRKIKMEKLILNVGAIGNELDKSVKLLEIISRKKVMKVKSRMRIPALGVSPGLEVAAMVTIRGTEAIALLKRLLGAVNNSLKKGQIEENHFSFGIKEYIEIQGMDYYRDIGMKGLDVTVVFSRAGLRVKKKKIKAGKLPKKQFVTREEIIEFMKKNFNTEVI